MKDGYVGRVTVPAFSAKPGRLFPDLWRKA
jgi:hypothetical protein